MTREHLKESDVVAAAKTIAAHGEIPTIAAVRKHLQGRGSETTILNHLRKWKLQLLGFAVFCDTAEIDPVCVLQVQQQYEHALQQLDLQSEKILELEGSVAHYQTESLVLVHGVKRLNEQVQNLQHSVALYQAKIDGLQQVNTQLSAVDALLKQKDLNNVLQTQVQKIRLDIKELLS